MHIIYDCSSSECSNAFCTSSRHILSDRSIRPHLAVLPFRTDPPLIRPCTLQHINTHTHPPIRHESLANQPFISIANGVQQNNTITRARLAKRIALHTGCTSRSHVGATRHGFRTCRRARAERASMYFMLPLLTCLAARVKVNGHLHLRLENHCFACLLCSIRFARSPKRQYMFIYQ